MTNLISSNHFILIDMGTNKIVFVEYKKNKRDTLELIKWNHIKTSGLDGGKIVSLDQTSRSIKKIFSRYNLKKEKKNIIVSISDHDLRLTKTYFDLDINGHKVNKRDIRNVFSKNLNRFFSSGMYLLHTIPTSFFIDDKITEKNPIGVSCRKLGLRSINFLIKEEIINQYKKTFKKSEIIQPDNFIYSGLASSISSLTKMEKENGATSIDFGAGSLKIVTFYKNTIEFVKNIPLGGDNVTNDISKILEINIDQAEYIKIVNGNLSLFSQDKFKIEEPNGSHKVISSNLLQGIIKPRYEEIIEICRNVLDENLISRSGMDTIVFSGGGAEIRGFQSFSSKIFNRKVRISKPLSFHKDLEKPEFTTLNGLVKICNDATFKNILINKSIQNENGIIDRFSNWILDSIT